MTDQPPTTPAVRDPGHIKIRVTELLEALGSTREQVADTLRARGIRGETQSCGRCPIATYLMTCDLRPHAVSVDSLEVALHLSNNPGDVVYVDTTDAVTEFVLAFDAGLYVYLDAAAHAAAVMDDLVRKVLARFAVELREADDDLQLVHLAQRAEARYASDLGNRMRALVDDERARRVFTAGIVGAR